MQGQLFSIGSIVTAGWRPRWPVLPWVLSAAALAALACCDLLLRGDRIDFILVGLAGYELVIGLTEETA